MPLQKRVDQLPAATGVTGTDLIILSRPSGPTGTVGTRAVRLSQLTDYMAALGGVTGPQGAAGPTGADSTVPGPTGPSGPRGNDGAAGAQGDRGPTGEAGPRGNDGAAGQQGPTGNTGPSGSSVTGPTGARGADGAAGAPGDSVTGPTGVPGVAGSNGAAGQQGPTGPSYSTTVTGVLLSGTGTYNPLVLDGAYDAYYLTLATGAAIQCLSITGPTGTTKLFLNIGSTGIATINHATGANVNSRISTVTQGSLQVPTLGGSFVGHYDGSAWRVL